MSYQRRLSYVSVFEYLVIFYWRRIMYVVIKVPILYSVCNLYKTILCEIQGHYSVVWIGRGIRVRQHAQMLSVGATSPPAVIEVKRFTKI